MENLFSKRKTENTMPTMCGGAPSPCANSFFLAFDDSLTGTGSLLFDGLDKSICSFLHGGDFLGDGAGILVGPLFTGLRL